MTRSRTLLPVLLWLSGIALSTSPAAAQLSSPLEFRIPKTPTIASGEGGAFLVYELHLTNFAPGAVTLRKIEVLTAGPNALTLLALEDSALARALSRRAYRERSSIGRDSAEDCAPWHSSGYPSRARDLIGCATV